MKGQSGKGSGARQGQYSPSTIAAYSRNYERIFGQACRPCRGKGYTWEENNKGNMAKVTCILCQGRGRKGGT